MSTHDADFGERTEFYTFAPESLGAALPELEIIREVGKGSMGIVYEARRRADGERVAVKILPPSLTLTERTLARFLREAELMRRVEHPSIAKVLDLGRSGRLSFFVMEFVDGTTLDARMAVGPLPVLQVAEIGAAAARALHFAHERGVVHRDLKPGNLMLRDDGTIVITDFGLARESGSGSMTESGAIVGTPMYMAPEQALGDRDAVGTRSDVYGLGATLYALLVGAPPFEGPNAQNVLKQVLDTRPPRPRTRRADVPRPLEAILLKAMEREPAMRYGTAAEMAEDLEHFVRGEPVGARLPGPLARAWRRASERPLLTSLSAVIVVLAIGAMILDRELAHSALEAELAGAERTLALASRALDDLGRRIPAEERSSLLFSTVAQASGVIAEDAGYWRAWFVRAKARHQLRAWAEAIDDLDAAERALGQTTPELLHYRIDAASHLRDADSQDRLLADLRQLLDLDPSARNRCVVAGQMLSLAEVVPEDERGELLATVERVLGDGATQDPHAIAIRARLLELHGDRDGALRTIRDATGRFPGDAVVHATAAAMFRRLGLGEEGEAAAARARAIDPSYAEPGDGEIDLRQPGVDVGEMQGFLEDLEGLIRAVDDKK